jgi:hypothetical protein
MLLEEMHAWSLSARGTLLVLCKTLPLVHLLGIVRLPATDTKQPGLTSSPLLQLASIGPEQFPARNWISVALSEARIQHRPSFQGRSKQIRQEA